MEGDSIAKLLNPNGYCVPELKDFFKKREPAHHDKSSKEEKFNLKKKNGVKKLKSSKGNVSAGLEDGIFDSSLQIEDDKSDHEREVGVPGGRHIRRRKKKVPINEEKESRTIFVGNLPNTWNKMKIKRYFSKYGTVENLRLRCAPLADPRVPKKVAVIKKNFHPDRSSIHGFVCFTDKESACKALQANGAMLADHHVRVDLALNNSPLNYDRRKAIFIGNVPFSAEEDDLWSLFENCGSIDSIRVLRDRKSGVGKGFAYVNFKTPDAVELALKMNGEKLKERELRISRYTNVKKKKEKKVKKNKIHRSIDKDNSSKSSRGTRKKEVAKVIDDDSTAEVLDGDSTAGENKTLQDKKHSSGTRKVQFQGQAVSGTKKLKKKKKVSKAVKKKKLLIEKLAGGLSKKKVNL